MKLTNQEEKEILKYIDTYDFKEYLQDKTILITGSKGIVGSGIIKWVLKENELHGTNARIIASTRNPKRRPDWITEEDNIEFCTFGKELEELADQPIDYVIHSAAPTSNKVFKAQPVESLKVILDGTENMLNLTKEKNAQMIYLSSEEAYGTPDLEEPVKETFVGAVDSLSTRSCYPLGKKVAELLCRSYFEEYAVNVKIIRPTVILGLWQEYESVKVEAEILRCIMENKNLMMLSDGSTMKSVIYSLDAISAVLTVLFRGNGGEAYNATNPYTYCSVKDRAYKAFAEFNEKLDIEFAKSDISKASGYLPKRAICEDITKISGLGWKPERDMSDIYRLDIERFTESRKN